jgi:dephospho-CoA kinase
MSSSTKKPSRNKKIILGLTGGVASGKTTVAAMFKSSGARIIDADTIAHSLLKPDTEVYCQVVKTFGKAVLKKNRALSRKKLGRIVFNDKALRKKLNRIMHPEIIRIIRKKLQALRQGAVVLEAPLLIEAGLTGMVDKLIVVNLSLAKQIKRIQQKTLLTKEEVFKRIRSQMPLEKKVRLADFIIDNNGTRKQTKKQVMKLRRLLWKS